MTRESDNVRALHRHRKTTTTVVVQRAGVPYELERTICRECSAVLSERSVKRAAA